MNITKDKSGQSLLELIVAISVITVGLFSVWALFLSNFKGEQEAGARIMAINLAREGIEIARNMRDSNWLAIEDNASCVYNTTYNPCKWDSGLSAGVSVPKNNFNPDPVYLDHNVTGLDDEGSKIYEYGDVDVYYNDYDPTNNPPDTPTIYRRVIEIENICCADADSNLKCDNKNFNISPNSCSGLKIGLDVKSKVRWTLEGKNRELTIHNQMFNWK